jgi:hypothetical protein
MWNDNSRRREMTSRINVEELVEIYHLMRENHQFPGCGREIVEAVLSATKCKQATYWTFEGRPSLARGLHSPKASVSTRGFVQS